MEKIKNELKENGFAILPKIYSADEINQLLVIINQMETNKATFRKSADLFAIRQFLKEIPETKAIIFNDQLKRIIHSTFGTDYFIVKSIYFDKPEKSNWFVAYHQDLTISVDQKIQLENFGPWTVKQDQFAVQPPIDILESNFTIRVHLDDTDENNGALKVIPKSHTKGVYRAANIDWENEIEVSCNVKKGGVMIMKPLLLHSSAKTTNDQKRRVIHIEFTNKELPLSLQWSEKDLL